MVIWESGKDVEKIGQRLQARVDLLASYCDRWRLKVNFEKTVYTIFSLSPRAQKLEVLIRYGNGVLRKDESPTYLGVKLDPDLGRFRNHVLVLADKAAQKLIILKKLASTNWGARYRTLRQLYLGHVRAIMDTDEP